VYFLLWRGLQQHIQFFSLNAIYKTCFSSGKIWYYNTVGVWTSFSCIPSEWIKTIPIHLLNYKNSYRLICLGFNLPWKIRFIQQEGVTFYAKVPLEWVDFFSAFKNTVVSKIFHNGWGFSSYHISIGHISKSPWSFIFACEVSFAVQYRYIFSTPVIWLMNVIMIRNLRSLILQPECYL
jgi:hypothetical protein